MAEKVKLTGAGNGAGTAADAKALSIVGGMIAGADSIDDLDVPRHGGLPRLFGGVRALSTLGTFLRGFTWGRVRRPQSATRAFVCNLAAHTGLVPTADEVVFADIDSRVKQVYGPARQGASFGCTTQRGPHFQFVTVKTGTCTPVIVATRLRKGSANSGRGAASLLREALATVRAMGITAQIIVRADSAYSSPKAVEVCREADARFSLAAAVRKKIREAIAPIAEDTWTPRRWPFSRTATASGVVQHRHPPYTDAGLRSMARALAVRLRDRATEYQRYMVDFSVPFDNHQAERDLRIIKVQQNVSGAWGNLTGAKRFARIRSCISTVRKHGISPLTALRDLFAGRP